MTPSKSSNRDPKGSTQGFTLIEVLIYAALLSVGLAMLSTVFASGLRTRSIIVAETDLVASQQFVEQTIRSRLEESSGVISPVSGSASSLVIASPTPSEHPVTFALGGNALTIAVGAGAPEALTPANVRVTAFTVTRLSGSPASLLMTIAFEVDTASNATVQDTSSFSYTFRYE